MTSAQHCIKHCVSLAADIASSIASNIAPNIALRHETRLARHVVLCIPNSGNQLLLVILLPGVHDDPSFLGDKSGCSVGCFTGELFLSLIKEARPSTSLSLPQNCILTSQKAGPFTNSHLRKEVFIPLAYPAYRLSWDFIPFLLTKGPPSQNSGRCK